MTTDVDKVAWERVRVNANHEWKRVELTGRVRRTRNNPNHEGAYLFELEVILWGEGETSYNPETRTYHGPKVELKRYWAEQSNIKLLPPITVEIIDDGILGIK
tara:strand:+ start:2281 stop:2589 length:309 start_codon:yes stop_codon:yes gene_type:complete